MVTVASSRFNDLLRRLNGFRCVLLYGTNKGLISELSRRIREVVTSGRSDSVISLDEASISQDPGLLKLEMSCGSLFSQNRIVWLRGISDRQDIARQIERILSLPSSSDVLVIEAGSLKKGVGLRKLIEASPVAASVPCYEDGPVSVSNVIDEEASKFGLSVDKAAKEMLEQLLTGDRLVLRGEMQKLCLYAQGKDRISPGDVTAVVRDSADASLNSLIDAIAVGDIGSFSRLYHRLMTEGLDAGMLLRSSIKHFHLLQILLAKLDRGASKSQAIDEIKPPVFFKRVHSMTRQLGLWNQENLKKSLVVLREALRNSYLHSNPSLVRALACEALLRSASCVSQP